MNVIKFWPIAVKLICYYYFSSRENLAPQDHLATKEKRVTRLYQESKVSLGTYFVLCLLMNDVRTILLHLFPLWPQIKSITSFRVIEITLKSTLCPSMNVEPQILSVIWKRKCSFRCIFKPLLLSTASLLTFFDLLRYTALWYSVLIKTILVVCDRNPAWSSLIKK